MEKTKTLKEQRPGAYEGLKTIYRAASKTIRDPQYARAAPIPEKEDLDSWGIEMLYLGMMRGYKLARLDMREENICNSQSAGDLQTFGISGIEVDNNDDVTVKCER